MAEISALFSARWGRRVTVAALLVALTSAAACTGSSDRSTATRSASASAAPVTASGATSGTSGVAAASAPPSTSTTTVPDPDGTTARGNISQTVAPVTPTTLPAVSLSRSVSVGSAVRVSLRGVRAVRVTAQGPGEISGPALAITVQIANSSGRLIDVGNAFVQVIDARGRVATPTTASPAAPLAGRLASGRNARGVYVVMLAEAARHTIQIYVSYAAGKPVAHFRGNAA